MSDLLIKLNSLPIEIENKIKNKYWQYIYYNNVIKELNQIKKNQLKLFNFITNKDILIINKSKMNEYKEINNLLKENLNYSSFRLLTNCMFFKKFKSNNKIFERFDESIKYTIEFIIYFSNYMSTKVYYDFINLK